MESLLREVVESFYEIEEHPNVVKKLESLVQQTQNQDSRHKKRSY